MTTQLSLIRQGGLLAEIDEALSALVREVCYAGKGGSITIKIGVKPATKTSSSSVIISSDVNLKAPKLPAAESILFAGDDGILSESDPRQQRLNFAPVEPDSVQAEPTETFRKVN